MMTDTNERESNQENESSENQALLAQIASLETALKSSKEENTKNEKLLTIAYTQLNDLKIGAQCLFDDSQGLVKMLQTRQDQLQKKLENAETMITNKTSLISLLSEQITQLKQKNNEEKEEFRKIARVIQESASEAVANIPLNSFLDKVNQSFDRLKEISNTKKVPSDSKKAIHNVTEDLKANLTQMQFALQKATSILNQESNKADLLEAVYRGSDQFFN